MMRRRVVPNEELGHLWPQLAQRLHKRLTIIGAAALPYHSHEVSRPDIERAMNHPPPIAPTDDDDVLLPPFGPGAALAEGNSRRVVSSPTQTSFPSASAC
jgi:hypothetical protein